MNNDVRRNTKMYLKFARRNICIIGIHSDACRPRETECRERSG
jgi:hypothetical protein